MQVSLTVLRVMLTSPHRIPIYARCMPDVFALCVAYIHTPPTEAAVATGGSRLISLQASLPAPPPPAPISLLHVFAYDLIWFDLHFLRTLLGRVDIVGRINEAPQCPWYFREIVGGGQLVRKRKSKTRRNLFQKYNMYIPPTYHS